jgi:hypothetical protein
MLVLHDNGVAGLACVKALLLRHERYTKMVKLMRCILRCGQWADMISAKAGITSIMQCGCSTADAAHVMLHQLPVVVPRCRLLRLQCTSTYISVLPAHAFYHSLHLGAITQGLEAALRQAHEPVRDQQSQPVHLIVSSSTGVVTYFTLGLLWGSWLDLPATGANDAAYMLLCSC